MHIPLIPSRGGFWLCERRLHINYSPQSKIRCSENKKEAESTPSARSGNRPTRLSHLFRPEGRTTFIVGSVCRSCSQVLPPIRLDEGFRCCNQGDVNVRFSWTLVWSHNTDLWTWRTFPLLESSRRFGLERLFFFFSPLTYLTLALLDPAAPNLRLLHASLHLQDPVHHLL